MWFADLLMQAARESLDELLRDARYLGARPGILSALHTWGRNLSVHPHVHCLVTAGGIDGEGRFVPLKNQTLLPARVLMAVFRGKLRHLLLQSLDGGRLRIPTGTSVARIQSLLNRLGRIPWNVRIQERYSHGVSVAGYLARYLTGGPISNHRIDSMTDDAVVFWYRDHRDGVKKRMSLTPTDFLSRWFEHVPPRGLRMIRRSGLYANSRSKQREAIQEHLRASQPQCTRETVSALEQERCPVCNTEVVCREVIVIRIPHPNLRENLVHLNQPP